jgi:uncharacterized protein YfaP (DUF2135 family)
VRTATTLTAFLLLLALAVPAAAQTEPTAPCDAPTTATPLTAAGASETFAPAATPAFGHDILVEADPTATYGEESVTRFTYRLDTSGDAAKPTSTKATLDIDMDWDDDVSDFDLYVLDADGNRLSEDGASNTLFTEVVDGGSGEHIAGLPLAHCAEVVLEVVNYSGLPTASIDLDVTVKLR